jgi:hypothetical protein
MRMEFHRDGEVRRQYMHGVPTGTVKWESNMRKEFHRDGEVGIQHEDGVSQGR